VATVSALNRTDDRQHPPVQLWYTNTMTTGILSRWVRPDSIVVVTTGAGSAVLALEIDEGTTYQRTVRAKLAAYRRPLSTRPAWQLVVVVPGQIRSDWMVRQAAAMSLGPSAWVVTLGDLADGSLDAELRSVARGHTPRSLRSLLQPPRRLLSTPVGSHAWLELRR